MTGEFGHLPRQLPRVGKGLPPASGERRGAILREERPFSHLPTRTSRQPSHAEEPDSNPRQTDTTRPTQTITRDPHQDSLVSPTLTPAQGMGPDGL